MYFILILITIITIFTSLIIVDGLYKIKETFKSDYSDYNQIDRIQVDDKFAYCIGGIAKCNTGVPIKGGVYANGNTYKSNCDDGSNMVCKNFVSTNLDICGNSYLWRTPNYKPLLFSQTYQGFTEPTSYIPAVINNNLINFYDKNSIIDTINKCDVLGLDANNCKKVLKIPFTFADTKSYISGNKIYDGNAMNNQTGYIDSSAIVSFDVSSYTEKPPISNGTSGMYPNLPCIADYGALPGDNICNGEVGLIQDDTLVCPYYKPICKGYRCDSTPGSCDYSM
jgi:hypothetical protein